MAHNPSDFDLRQPSDEIRADGFTPGLAIGPPPRQSKAALLWIVAALLVAAAGFAAYYLYRNPAPSSTTAGSTTKPAAADADSRAALGRDPLAITLPPIEQSDEVVRKLVSALSSHPTVAAWLATDGLVRNFTAVVSNIAEDDPPVVHVARLRPSARFQIIERNGDMVVDPRSYERYTPMASAISALDPQGSARLYATLKPLIEQAHRDLGYGNTSFDQTLERAIVKLLATPTPREPVRVVPRGIVYGFEDPRLEGLSPAQKHLLRFGPDNARVVKQALRNLAEALGIPKERLPQ
jgi:hypothetical protein